MRHSLQSHATAAQECAHALERALESSRSQWDDATRQSFDLRYAELVVTSARKVANELTYQAQELDHALAVSQ
jgi:hypothetical protein